MNNGHKCFISYKSEDIEYKKKISELFKQKSVGVIDKSLDYRIQSDNPDYIMQTIRDNYLSDSTVTVFLIGDHSSELEGKDYDGYDKNYYIEHELQASLYNGKGNTRNGIVGIVLPEMESVIFRGNYKCDQCGGTHQHVAINDNTVIREFSVNYYMEPHDGCSWSENERYCVLTTYAEFLENPEEYIEKAFNKRFSPLSEKLRIRNLR